MRCQEFETHVIDLARRAVMDAAIRAEALGHAGDCPQCGSLLADQRQLSEGLRELAAKGRDLEPPAAVEAALIEAFRENRAAPLIARHRQWTPWLAVAAILLAVFGAVTLMIRATEDSQPVVPAGPDLARETARPVDEQPAMPALEHQTEPPAVKAGHSRRPMREPDSRLTGREITTDFIPLSYGAEYIPIESGQIIRVKLPRSSLISFGLPMSQERVDEQVKADILVSNDGLAHAIRFVQ
ncbi:MAG: hypothetical protein IPM66_17150 [Acidobacteriota bacterium]|nr:MAG: hypothetical protein IPM66_17150 [Acidobacteriota bacterium]